MNARSLLLSALLTSLSLPLAAQQSQPLSPVEKAMAAYIDAHQQDSNGLLQKLVEINSGTHNLEGVRAVGTVMMAQLSDLGFSVRWIPMDEVQRGRCAGSGASLP